MIINYNCSITRWRAVIFANQMDDHVEIPMHSISLGLLVVGFELGAEGSPLVCGQILSVAHLQHGPALLHEAFLVGAGLPDELVAVEAEDELGLGLDEVVLGDLGRDVAVHLHDLHLLEGGGQFADVLVSDAAVGVPLRSEVDDHEGEPVAGQVVREQV